jgi:hypothetical protein
VGSSYVKVTGPLNSLASTYQLCLGCFLLEAGRLSLIPSTGSSFAMDSTRTAVNREALDAVALLCNPIKPVREICSGTWESHPDANFFRIASGTI